MDAFDPTITYPLAKPIIKKWESLRLKPYLCPAGVWSIGWGTTRYPDKRTVKATDKDIDQPFAEVCLTAELSRLTETLRRWVTYPEATAEQVAACLCLTYNVGLGIRDGKKGDFADSNLLAKFNAGDIPGAAHEFDDWVYAHVNGEVTKLDGLVHRRADEKALFLRGVTDFSKLEPELV